MDTSATVWQANERAHELSLQAMAECILDIRQAKSILDDKAAIAADRQGYLRTKMAREMSIAVRKLLLDGGASLLKTCIARPSLPAVAAVAEGPTLRTETRREKVEGVAVRQGGREQAFSFPEATHSIELRPLPGIEFREGGACTVRPPFATSGSGYKLTRWLKQRVYQVDSVVFTAEKLLRLVANFEGAHKSTLRTMVASGLPLDAIGRGAEMEYRVGNLVRFGGLSYPQLFTVYTAVQIMHQSSRVAADVLNRQRGGTTPSEAQQSAPTMSPVIAQPVLDTQITCSADPVLIFGDDGEAHPREGQPTHTEVRVPAVHAGRAVDGADSAADR